MSTLRKLNNWYGGIAILIAYFAIGIPCAIMNWKVPNIPLAFEAFLGGAIIGFTAVAAPLLAVTLVVTATLLRAHMLK